MPHRSAAAALLLLGLTLALLLIAYQSPFQQTIAVGGDRELLRRLDDQPFLSGFNGPEPADRLADPDRPECAASAPAPGCTIAWHTLLERRGELPYRWAGATARVAIPGVGGGAYIVELLAQSGRPDGSPAPVRWRSGGLALALSLPAGQPRRYRLLAPASPAGDLSLDIESAVFSPPGDPRELGFVLHQVRASAVAGLPRAPAWPQVGALLLLVGLIYALARMLAAPAVPALGLAAAAALSAALALAFSRTALTVFTPALVGLALSCAALALAGRALIGRIAPPAARPLALWILGLTTLAFALRMAGMLHPHAVYSDSGFNANNLLRVSLGQVFLEAGLPSEAGGGAAPYPPGLYLLALPAQLLIPAGHEARVLLLQSVAALLDSLALPLIAWLLLRAGQGAPAALFGAACYLLPITALESFAVGELANLGGQALAMPFVLLLGIGALAAGGSPGPARIAAVAALAAGLLGHSGVTLSLGALVAAAWLIALARWRDPAAPVAPQRVTIVAAAGLSLVLAIYYSAYLGGLLGRGPSSAGEAGLAGGLGLAALARETLLAPLGLQPPLARAWALPLPLGAGALAGLWLLLAARNQQPAAGPLRALLIAWWLGFLITQALLLVASQGLRWSIFLYPALCLGAGVALGRLWAAGAAGRAAALAAAAATLGYGLFMWVVQVRDYFHR